MAENNSKWPIICDFPHFMSIILSCGCGHKFLTSPLKFGMHVTNHQFSDQFNNGLKESKWLIYCDFLHFTTKQWQTICCLLYV